MIAMKKKKANREKKGRYRGLPSLGTLLHAYAKHTLHSHYESSVQHKKVLQESESAVTTFRLTSKHHGHELEFRQVTQKGAGSLSRG
jgi:hypothetical protein